MGVTVNVKGSRSLDSICSLAGDTSIPKCAVTSKANRLEIAEKILKRQSPESSRLSFLVINTVLTMIILNCSNTFMKGRHLPRVASCPEKMSYGWCADGSV